MDVLATMVALALQAPAAPTPDPCRVDNRAMTELGFNSFDQDMNGGWRELSQRPGCKERAADLIRSYRELSQRRMATLYWHEGQLRAILGQTDQAVRLFEQARHDSDEDGWNHYVDATIAFLRGDRAALARARDRLAALPPPPDFADWRGVSDEPIRWPLNLDVVDGFMRCFGRPYEEAYGSNACRGSGGQRQ